MPFHRFDPPTTTLLYSVYHAALRELREDDAALSTSEWIEARVKVGKRLIAAAEAGERDPKALKRVALKGLNETEMPAQVSVIRKSHHRTLTVP